MKQQIRALEDIVYSNSCEYSELEKARIRDALLILREVGLNH